MKLNEKDSFLNGESTFTEGNIKKQQNVTGLLFWILIYHC